MMTKKILLLFFAFLPLLAIDIKLSPDQKIEITPQEIQKTIDKALAKRIRIEKKDAKDVAFDNRLLANELLKNNLLLEDVALELKLSLEENFADLFVAKHQETIAINDHVLESYYNTHKKEFQEDQLVDVVIYEIKEFETASKLYDTFKNTPHNAETYAKEHNITSSTQKSELSKLSPVLKDALRDYEQKNYLTPPLFFQKKFFVVYIKDIAPNPNKNFKHHQDYITAMLKQKTLRDTRTMLLQKLKETK